MAHVITVLRRNFAIVFHFATVYPVMCIVSKCVCYAGAKGMG